MTPRGERPFARSPGEAARLELRGADTFAPEVVALPSCVRDLGRLRPDLEAVRPRGKRLEWGLIPQPRIPYLGDCQSMLGTCIQGT